MDPDGFPRTAAKASKVVQGSQTGEMVTAVVKAGKKVGGYTGRVAIRSNGYFDMQTATQKVTGVSWKCCRSVHKTDGYTYITRKEKGIPPLGGRPSGFLPEYL
jgi:hypothetical protein